MSVITIERCPVCGSGDLKKIFDAVDHFSSKEVFPVCDCTVCGFRFTNNFPSEDVIGKYYDSPDYISHSDSDKGLINKLYHLFREHMLKRKVKVAESFVKGYDKTLLDIGCGTGYFMNAAEKYGFTVSGIEKNKKAREWAINHFALDVKDEKSFFEMKDVSFSIITLWHVLEHLEKPNETIDKIKDILAPDGTVVLALPNHHSYDARFYKEMWAAYDTPRHLWHFTPVSVEQLLAGHRMKIVKRFRMPLDAFYISLLSEKYKGSPVVVKYIRAFSIGIAGFVFSLFQPECSSSMIYIAKRISEE